MIKSREDMRCGICSMHGDMRNADKILVAKPSENRPLWLPRYRENGNIGMVVEYKRM
jgi:hypothetical protein